MLIFKRFLLIENFQKHNIKKNLGQIKNEFNCLFELFRGRKSIYR